MGKARTIKSNPEIADLDRLADLLGIEGQYSDARRKVQRTSEETKRALLEAMGVPAKNDAQIRASLREKHRAEWKGILQPVYVARVHHGQVNVQVVLPEAAQEVAWRLKLEHGAEQPGRAAVSELPLIEQREMEGEKIDRRQLTLGPEIPWGYHQLKIEPGGSEAAIIATPERCWLPRAAEEGQKIWGIAAQLYTLQSRENWGIGDFDDLRRLAESWARAGANLVGVNPLHALFVDKPDHASPYSPSSRLLLNVLYIDVTAVAGFAECAEAQKLVHSDEFQAELRECRSNPLVDYARVTKLKLQALRLLFNYGTASGDAARKQFEEFRRERGAVLERSCLFYSMRETFASQSESLRDWRNWPEEYRDPDSQAVRKFAGEHENEIAFHAWTQWLADIQLGSAAQAAKGMEIGLYRDMAVGADMCGVETWSNQTAVVSGAHIGAPPDIFNPAGQDWGLPPFHPHALKQERYESFVDLIRANMRYAGALRIDHVMALRHLYWIPAGESPKNGAYVRYPLEDLIGILALESHRNRCMVVGEDLGTVPDGFRERMADASILSYRVLFFEQNAKSGAFRKPKDYPRLAVAVASNHDLPTVPAWWEGHDIELRARLKLYPDAQEAEFQTGLRQRDREQLRRALESQGLLKKGTEPEPEEWVRLVYGYLARSNSFAVLVQLEDIAGEIDSVNVPGSTDQYPNWRRKLAVPLEELLEKALGKEIVRIFSEQRASAKTVLEKATQ